MHKTIRLMVMMFLQFFVWGAWYTSIAVYMTARGMGDPTHWAYTVVFMAGFALLVNDRVDHDRTDAACVCN